jgi:hypothetical protein
MASWFRRGGAAVTASGVVAVGIIAACSDPREPAGAEPGSGGATNLASISGPNGEGIGTVRLQLQIGPGDYLYSLSYACTGPSVIPPGTVNFNDAQSVEYTLGGVAAGSGYQCALSGTDSNGDICSGTTTAFSVVAGQVSGAGAVITCTVATDAALAADVANGSVGFDAAVQVVSQSPYGCPGITAFSVVPSELIDSQTSQLTVGQTGPIGLAPDGGPTLSDVVWSAACASPPCGTFSPSTVAAAPTFVCGATAQQVTITAQVTDFQTNISTGVTSDVCAGRLFTTMQATISCEHACVGAPLGASCNINGGSICNGGGTCVVPSFDVVRLGNGAPVSAGITVPVFIDQYSLSGALLASTALPTAVSGTNQPLTLVGSEVSEGDLTTSVDGRLLVLAGHNYVPGATVSAANTGVAFISGGPTPTVNTSLQLPLALSAGGLVRSAASLDGTQVWVAGAGTGTTGGLWYMPGDVQVVKTSTATTGRDVRISSGQLYADSNATPPGLFTVGSGEPISGTPAPTLTELPGLPTSGGSPYAFVFLTVNGVQTLYVADDQGNGVGGVLKYVLSGGSWSKVGAATGVTPPDAGTATAGYRGLAGYVTGSTVTLMASSGMAAGGIDELVLIVDTGTATPSQTPVAISAPNETFRGIAVPPHP